MLKSLFPSILALAFCHCATEGFTVEEMNDPDVPDTTECRASDLQTLYLDADGDGYGDPASASEDCKIPEGYVLIGGDCDDAEPLAYEGATEYCGDKIDNNCSGSDACVASLVGHWTFAETMGLSAGDESGNLMEGILQNGLIHGTAPALTFDGTDDYVEVPHMPAMELGVGTVSFWFMPTLEGAQQSMLSKDSNGNDAGGHMSFYFDGNASVRARLQSNNETYDISSLPLTLNEWHYVAFTFGGNEGMTLYVDDVEAAKDPYTGGLTRNEEPLVIGAGTDNSGDLTAEPINKAFAGQVSDVQFYDRQLLRDELTSVHLVTNPVMTGL